jgi:hypothetical protein
VDFLIGPVAGAVLAVGMAQILRGPAMVSEATAAEGTPLNRSHWRRVRTVHDRWRSGQALDQRFDEWREARGERIGF